MNEQTDFNMVVAGIFQDKAFREKIQTEVVNLLKKYKMDASTFVYVPKIYFPLNGSKADVQIAVEVKKR